MTDIQFYHLTSSPLDRALPKLLEKALSGGFRVRINAGTEDKAEALNVMLWAYDPASFLPHGTEKDGNSSDQPIYIAAGNENPNQADLAVVTDGADASPEAGCKRVLDMFDGTDEQAVAGARARWKSYQAAGHNVSYIKQNNAGGWEKQGG